MPSRSPCVLSPVRLLPLLLLGAPCASRSREARGDGEGLLRGVGDAVAREARVVDEAIARFASSGSTVPVGEDDEPTDVVDPSPELTADEGASPAADTISSASGNDQPTLSPDSYTSPLPLLRCRRCGSSFSLADGLPNEQLLLQA